MSSSNSDELTQIRRAQEQLLVAISNMSAKCDLLLQSRIDGLGNREGIGTYQIWVPTDGVGVDDPRQGVNHDHQQKEQLRSSSCRQHRDDHVQDINSNRQQQEQTWSSGGRQQQGLPSMEVPTMFPSGRLQQGILGLGMEHVRPNAQEGFHQHAPNEDCSKLMDCCYKGILDYREGIRTSHIRVYANGGNVNDQAATTTNSHLLFQQQQHLLFQMLAHTQLHFGEPSHMAVRSFSLDHHGLHHQESERVHLSSRFPHNFQSSGDFDCGTPPSKKKGFKLDKLDFNFNGPGGFDLNMGFSKEKKSEKNNELHYNLNDNSDERIMSLVGINAWALRHDISSRLGQLLFLYHFLTFCYSNGGYFLILCNLCNLGDKVLVKGRVNGMNTVSKGYDGALRALNCQHWNCNR